MTIFYFCKYFVVIEKQDINPFPMPFLINNGITVGIFYFFCRPALPKVGEIKWKKVKILPSRCNKLVIFSLFHKGFSHYFLILKIYGVSNKIYPKFVGDLHKNGLFFSFDLKIEPFYTAGSRLKVRRHRQAHNNSTAENTVNFPVLQVFVFRNSKIYPVSYAGCVKDRPGCSCEDKGDE